MNIIGRGQAIANTNQLLLTVDQGTATTFVDAENTFNQGGTFIIDVTEAGVKQVETATLIGTITGSGDIDVTVTAAGMTGSPKTIPVSVLVDDTASDVAAKVVTALQADVDVTALYDVTGTGATVILTEIVPNGNDATLNIATATGTATGLTAAPTSANTTAGTTAISVTPKIEAIDSHSGKVYAILTGTAIVGIETRILRVHPLLTASANLIAADLLPLNYRVTMTHGDTAVASYTIAINGN